MGAMADAVIRGRGNSAGGTDEFVEEASSEASEG
jgi:small subunit ribosomal protein S2